MREVKVTVKIMVSADVENKEEFKEAIFEELQAQMEEGELNYTFKVQEDDEEEEMFEEEND